jgi:dihydropteroate synthase
MGVLNVTPDSFSDGGRYLATDAAVARGIEMVAEGVDVVDVGGESTRPGADPVPAKEELRRVVPVVEALSGKVRVSIDTTKVEVAEAAIEAGATLVNDVGASLAGVAARHGAGFVALHRQGTPRTMQDDPRYSDVVSEVAAFLSARARHAADIGVEEVWIDPGIGFGKTVEHNLSLLRRLGDLTQIGPPLLVGTSRKSFLGVASGKGGGPPAPVGERFEASLATAVWAMRSGAAMVRVHDVRASVQAARLVGVGVAGSTASCPAKSAVATLGDGGDNR